MNKPAALALLLPFAFLSGCDPIGGCGAYNGAGDTVFQRGPSDVLVECANGGFVETTSTSVVEGMYFGNTGIDPASRAVVYTQTDNGDGTISTSGLGGGPWTTSTLDQVALDHLDTECTDLETRSWWGESMRAVEQVTEYINTASPITAASYRLILCPNATMYVSYWFGAEPTTYSIDAGHVEMENGGSGSGAFADLATLGTSGTVDMYDDPEPGYDRYWDVTTAEAEAAAKFCATGTWTAPESE